jgi:hypothetical protein
MYKLFRKDKMMYQYNIRIEGITNEGQHIIKTFFESEKFLDEEEMRTRKKSNLEAIRLTLKNAISAGSVAWIGDQCVVYPDKFCSITIFDEELIL